MKKHNLFKIILLLIIPVILFQTCRKQIEIEFPDIEPVLAVSCLFSPDSIIKLNLFKTSDFNDSTIYPVNDATCKLFANDNFLENLIIDNNGLYISPSNYKPKHNINYKIEISHPDYSTIYATDKLPEFPEIINITKQDSVMFDEDGNYLSSLFLTLKDNPDIENFYEIKIFVRYKRDYSQVWWLDTLEMQNIDTSFHTNLLILRSEDIVIKNEGLLDYYPTTYPFSDELFNGQTYTLNINYLLPEIIYGYNDYVVSLIQNYQLIVYLRSVSENYYNYKKKLIIHLENQYSDVWDGIGEPVQMYNNIQNGYGIFAGYTTYLDTIQ